MLTDSITTKIEFLEKIGADEKSHSSRTLLDHLLGTYNKLKEWNAPEYLQDAGLFHSVYGTSSFKHQSTNDRDAVRGLIGEQAEEIVFMFCSTESPRVEKFRNMQDGQLKADLLLLSEANSEDMVEARQDDSLDFYNV
jgi:hypothetical protein